MRKMSKFLFGFVHFLLKCHHGFSVLDVLSPSRV